jgi:hypothetical protein
MLTDAPLRLLGESHVVLPSEFFALKLQKAPKQRFNVVEDKFRIRQEDRRYCKQLEVSFPL